MRTALTACAALTLGALLLPVIIHAQSAAPAGVRSVQVRSGFHIIMGAGGNIGVQVGVDGVVLVDTGAPGRSDAVLAELRRITDQPIRYIINTGPAVDHIGGNAAIAKAGRSFFRQGGNGPAATNPGAAPIVGTEGLLLRLSTPPAGEQPMPVGAWPTESFARPMKDLFLNREAIQVIHRPRAISDGDAIVFFRRSDVIVTGDIFDITRFPVIDVTQGGSINGVIAALNQLVDLAVPSIPLPWLDDGGTVLIPGHGRPCEEAELVEYRDMVTIVRDRVQALIQQGLSLAEVKAANPTAGFRNRYGAESGTWTTDLFVEAVYRSLAVTPVG